MVNMPKTERVWWKGLGKKAVHVIAARREEARRENTPFRLIPR